MSATTPLTGQLTILNKRGLHLRFAGMIAAEASKYQSVIRISKGRRVADGKSMLDLTALSAAPGATLNIAVTGDDAETAMKAIQNLVASYLGDK